MAEGSKRLNFDLTDAAERAIAFREARDWAQFHSPKNLSVGLSIEAAELLELFQWSGIEHAREILRDDARMKGIRDELADVAVYLLTLSHDLEVDLAAAIASKIDSNELRYPVDEYKGSSKKAPPLTNDGVPA